MKDLGGGGGGGIVGTVVTNFINDLYIPPFCQPVCFDKPKFTPGRSWLMSMANGPEKEVTGHSLH